MYGTGLLDITPTALALFGLPVGADMRGRALIESFVPPDSAHPYVALSDSNGAFVIEHVPPAAYTIRAYLDRNKNLTVDPSEPWDSASASLTDSVRMSLVIFTHDTVPPRVADVRGPDSLTLQVVFDKPLDPAQTLTAANFAVIAPDSSRVPILSAGSAVKDTAAGLNPAPGANPPVRAPLPGRDTVVTTKPVMPRPVLINEAVIRLQHPLTPKLVYRVRAIGIRGLLKRSGDSERAYTAPAPAPPVPPGPKPEPVLPASLPPIKK